MSETGGGSRRVREALGGDFEVVEFPATTRTAADAVKALIGEPIEKADADFVREATGFAIGGVPPVAHKQPIRTLIDEDLMKLGEVWAAAGTPSSVFRLEAQRLVAITSGAVERIK